MMTTTDTARAAGLARMARSARWTAEADRLRAMARATTEASEAACDACDPEGEGELVGEAIALYRAARACDAVAQSVAYPHGAGWLADVLDAEDAARAAHPAVGL